MSISASSNKKTFNVTKKKIFHYSLGISLQNIGVKARHIICNLCQKQFKSLKSMPHKNEIFQIIKNISDRTYDIF